MTEKVKLTKEQAEAIEEFQKTVHELGISLDELKVIFESGYEVKPEFKENDWVKCGLWSGIYRITEVNEFTGLMKLDNDIDVHEDHLEHATPSEIAEEKERRWWNKHGREPWELRYNDTLICDKLPRIVDKIADLKKKTVIFTDGGWEYFDNVKEEYKVLVFAKDRLDVKTND